MNLSQCQRHALHTHKRINIPVGISVPRHPKSASSRPSTTLVQPTSASTSASGVSTQPASQQEKYDVYVDELKPLKEGEEKHVISVFVADESGLINRVAGVFARRGANIESMAVGLTVDKAMFTIVVLGTQSTVANLVKQLGKLVKVRYVEDITKSERLERELVLLKLRAPPGPARTEVLQLSQIFRARVVDVSDRTITLCVTGDPGKCAAIQQVMAKFGIVETARTGRVCLKRGENLMQQSSGYEPMHPASTLPGGPSTPFVSESRGADVYIVDDNAAGVWEVDSLLEATYSDPSGNFQGYTISIEVQDVAGVLNQVTGVFARRGYNVQSLAVGPSEKEGMSRITMVVPGSAAGIDKLMKQLNKLVYVQSVTDLTAKPFVNRELLLVKVRCMASQRGELRDLVSIFRGGIIDISANTLTVEVLGKADKMKALTDLLEPYGILEIARTGRVALTRESGIDSQLLESMSSGRVW